MVIGPENCRSGVERCVVCEPGVGPSSQRSGGGRGLGVFANEDDDDFDAALASPEMDALLSQRSSQRQPSQPGRPSQDAAQPTQSYPPPQPAYSPYGHGPQRGTGPPSGTAAGGPSGGPAWGQHGQASAWDYPREPPAAEVVDLSGEECIELE